MSVSIRPLAEHDLLMVLDIERRSHSHPWTQKNFEDAFKAGYAGFGLWEHETLIGFAWVLRAVDEAELLDVAIAPEFRRRGHAQFLLDEMGQRLVRAGTNRMHLEVRASNTGARALYATLGFHEVGVRAGYYPNGSTREDAILMKKELHDAEAR
jgi:[ribosomal protein S18]-alanine N-acetyltransferase